MMPSNADIQAAKSDFPLVFRDPPAGAPAQAVTLGGIHCAELLWCLYDFNFSPERIWVGLQRLGQRAVVSCFRRTYGRPGMNGLKY